MQYFSALEKAAQRSLRPLFQRLHFVPRQEVRTLSRRIGQLERYLQSHRTEAVDLPRTSGMQALDSLQYADLFWDEA
jgi:hypothetical protein